MIGDRTREMSGKSNRMRLPSEVADRLGPSYVGIRPRSFWKRRNGGTFVSNLGPVPRDVSGIFEPPEGFRAVAQVRSTRLAHGRCPSRAQNEFESVHMPQTRHFPRCSTDSDHVDVHFTHGVVQAGPRWAYDASQKGTRFTPPTELRALAS